MGPVSRLRRRADWPERLAALLLERRYQPFVWGEHDCCLFAADAVHAMTGHDPAAALRGTYATPEEAAEVLEAAGGVLGVVESALGEPQRIPRAQARRGDLVFYDTAQGPSVGIVIGTLAAFAAAEGMVLVRLSDCRGVAYRVPD